MNAPCLNYDIVAHMIHVAPWGSLNSIARLCRVTASIISPTWADRFVDERIIDDPLHPATAQMLPNGLRHGYTRQRAAVMYALGVPTHLHMRYPLACGGVDLAYKRFDTDVHVLMTLHNGVLRGIGLDQRGGKFIRTLNLRANDYDGWCDSSQLHPPAQLTHASIGGGYTAIEQPIRDTIAGWFAETPSWETVSDHARDILNALAGGPIDPADRVDTYGNADDPMFPGVVARSLDVWTWTVTN